MAGSSSSQAFQWGNKVAGSLSSYESMFFKGVRYDLYDCVFVRSGLAEPHLGKLMRLFDDEEGVKKVRLRWFIRPFELPGGANKDFQKEPNVKEVFIAQGNFKGVENENAVEVLLGKATVLCTAKFQDNPVPSQLVVDKAHFVFNRVYDVSNKRLGKIDKIDKSLGEHELQLRRLISVCSL